MEWPDSLKPTYAQDEAVSRTKPGGQPVGTRMPGGAPRSYPQVCGTLIERHKAALFTGCDLRRSSHWIHLVLFLHSPNSS